MDSPRPVIFDPAVLTIFSQIEQLQLPAHHKLYSFLKLCQGYVQSHIVKIWQLHHVERYNLINWLAIQKGLQWTSSCSQQHDHNLAITKGSAQPSRQPIKLPLSHCTTPNLQDPVVILSLCGYVSSVTDSLYHHQHLTISPDWNPGNGGGNAHAIPISSTRRPPQELNKTMIGLTAHASASSQQPPASGGNDHSHNRKMASVPLSLWYSPNYVATVHSYPSSSSLTSTITALWWVRALMAKMNITIRVIRIHQICSLCIHIVELYQNDFRQLIEHRQYLHTRQEKVLNKHMVPFMIQENAIDDDLEHVTAIFDENHNTAESSAYSPNHPSSQSRLQQHRIQVQGSLASTSSTSPSITPYSLASPTMDEQRRLDQQASLFHFPGESSQESSSPREPEPNAATDQPTTSTQNTSTEGQPTVDEDPTERPDSEPTTKKRSFFRTLFRRKPKQDEPVEVVSEVEQAPQQPSQPASEASTEPTGTGSSSDHDGSAVVVSPSLNHVDMQLDLHNTIALLPNSHRVTGILDQQYALHTKESLQQHSTGILQISTIFAIEMDWMNYLPSTSEDIESFIWSTDGSMPADVIQSPLPKASSSMANKGKNTTADIGAGSTQGADATDPDSTTSFPKEGSSSVHSSGDSSARTDHQGSTMDTSSISPSHIDSVTPSIRTTLRNAFNLAHFFSLIYGAVGKPNHDGISSSPAGYYGEITVENASSSLLRLGSILTIYRQCLSTTSNLHSVLTRQIRDKQSEFVKAFAKTGHLRLTSIMQRFHVNYTDGPSLSPYIQASPGTPANNPPPVSNNSNATSPSTFGTTPSTKLSRKAQREYDKKHEELIEHDLSVLNNTYCCVERQIDYERTYSCNRYGLNGESILVYQGAPPKSTIKSVKTKWLLELPTSQTNSSSLMESLPTFSPNDKICNASLFPALRNLRQARSPEDIVYFQLYRKYAHALQSDHPPIITQPLPNLHLLKTGNCIPTKSIMLKALSHFTNCSIMLPKSIPALVSEVLGLPTLTQRSNDIALKQYKSASFGSSNKRSSAGAYAHAPSTPSTMSKGNQQEDSSISAFDHTPVVQNEDGNATPAIPAYYPPSYHPHIPLEAELFDHVAQTNYTTHKTHSILTYLSPMFDLNYTSIDLLPFLLASPSYSSQLLSIQQCFVAPVFEFNAGELFYYVQALPAKLSLEILQSTKVPDHLQIPLQIAVHRAVYNDAYALLQYVSQGGCVNHTYATKLAYYKTIHKGWTDYIDHYKQLQRDIESTLESSSSAVAPDTSRCPSTIQDAQGHGSNSQDHQQHESFNLPSLYSMAVAHPAGRESGDLDDIAQDPHILDQFTPEDDSLLIIDETPLAMNQYQTTPRMPRLSQSIAIPQRQASTHLSRVDSQATPIPTAQAPPSIDVKSYIPRRLPRPEILDTFQHDYKLDKLIEIQEKDRDYRLRCQWLTQVTLEDFGAEIETIPFQHKLLIDKFKLSSGAYSNCVNILKLLHTQQDVLVTRHLENNALENDYFTPLIQTMDEPLPKRLPPEIELPGQFLASSFTLPSVAAHFYSAHVINLALTFQKDTYNSTIASQTASSLYSQFLSPSLPSLPLAVVSPWDILAIVVATLRSLHIQVVTYMKVYELLKATSVIIFNDHEGGHESESDSDDTHSDDDIMDPHIDDTNQHSTPGALFQDNDRQMPPATPSTPRRKTSFIPVTPLDVSFENLLLSSTSPKQGSQVSPDPLADTLSSPALTLLGRNPKQMRSFQQKRSPNNALELLQAIEQLRQKELHSILSPQEKKILEEYEFHFEHALETCDTDLSQISTQPVSADTLFPLVIYILAQSSLSCPWFLLELLSHLPDVALERGETGIMYSLFTAAVEYLSQFDENQLMTNSTGGDDDAMKMAKHRLRAESNSMQTASQNELHTLSGVHLGNYSSTVPYGQIQPVDSTPQLTPVASAAIPVLSRTPAGSGTSFGTSGQSNTLLGISQEQSTSTTSQGAPLSLDRDSMSFSTGIGLTHHHSQHKAFPSISNHHPPHPSLSESRSHQQQQQQLLHNSMLDAGKGHSPAVSSGSSFLSPGFHAQSASSVEKPSLLTLSLGTARDRSNAASHTPSQIASESNAYHSFTPAAAAPLDYLSASPRDAMVDFMRNGTSTVGSTTSTGFSYVDFRTSFTAMSLPNVSGFTPEYATLATSYIHAESLAQKISTIPGCEQISNPEYLHPVIDSIVPSLYKFHRLQASASTLFEPRPLFSHEDYEVFSLAKLPPIVVEQSPSASLPGAIASEPIVYLKSTLPCPATSQIDITSHSRVASTSSTSVNTTHSHTQMHHQPQQQQQPSLTAMSPMSAHGSGSATSTPSITKSVNELGRPVMTVAPTPIVGQSKYQQTDLSLSGVVATSPSPDLMIGSESPIEDDPLGISFK